jgi:hypothetical protein
MIRVLNSSYFGSKYWSQEDVQKRREKNPRNHRLDGGPGVGAGLLKLPEVIHEDDVSA